jgi:hypothetical protein
MDFEETERRMEELLAELSHGARRTGRGAWRLSLRNGGPVRARAVLRGRWLVIESPTRKRADHDPASFLRAHALLPGATRAVLPRGEKNVLLTAEVPAAVGIDCRPWIAEALLGLTRYSDALDGVREGNAERPAPSPLPAPPCEEAGDTSLDGPLEEAGWPFEKRSHGSLSVDLGVPHGAFRALVRRDERGVRLASRVARLGPVDDGSERALALFLLRAFAEIRLARPVLERGKGGETSVSFETRLHASPSSIETDHAVRALVVAARACGKEVSLFQSKRFASAYLRAFEREREVARPTPDRHGT